jgi:hypothetical protein
MTTKKDKFELRVENLGTGQEETLGVPIDGMQDPTGALPKRDYNYDVSINKAARGTKVNNLYVGGGDFGVPLNIAPQRPSQYPCNQVQETTSGHVIELDDTPGGERVLLRHRKGAGVEMRADGSVVISALNNKVEVTGGDQTVIIEGNGNLVYHGNLNMKVSGDYNIDVGGNFNVNVAGNLVEQIEQNHRTTVTENSQYTTKGTKTNKTIGTHTDVMLADNNQVVKGNQQNVVEGDIDIASEQNIFISGKEQFAVTSKVSNLTGVNNVSVFGQKGSIGGEQVDFTGRVYQGPSGATAENSGAIYHGTFKGIADEAVEAYNANVAQKAERADEAADITGTLVDASYTAGTPHNATASLATKSQASISGQAQITIDKVVNHGTTGSFAIQTVVVDADDLLKLKILLTDNYKDVFAKIPTTQEIRSSFRNSANIDAIGGVLVSEDRLNPKYRSKTPPSIGRTVKKTPSSRFGYEPIGNALENRGKRFTP